MGMSNECGNVRDLTIEVLKDIRSELRELRAETQGHQAEMKQGLGEVRDELHDLAEYTRAGFCSCALVGCACLKSTLASSRAGARATEIPQRA
jgi:1-deoxy-D-xylulose 5-phosphate reductoisomerase